MASVLDFEIRDPMGMQRVLHFNQVNRILDKLHRTGVWSKEDITALEAVDSGVIHEDALYEREKRAAILKAAGEGGDVALIDDEDKLQAFLPEWFMAICRAAARGGIQMRPRLPEGHAGGEEE